MFAEAGTELTGVATAFIDPFFFTDAAGYSIITSDGIGNSPSATPLPASLPLFATGLAGLGLLGWRRKRKAHIAGA